MRHLVFGRQDRIPEQHWSIDITKFSDAELREALRSPHNSIEYEDELRAEMRARQHLINSHINYIFAL